jgi:opacity protein-like surface antigen
MNRFLIAAALAVALGLGASNTAHAQIVYGYSVPTVGGVQSTGTVMSPWGAQTYNNFYSPFTGASFGQTYSTNVWGMGFNQTYGYNPYSGYRYGTNFYQPNYYVNPGFGYSTGYVNPVYYNYGLVRRR